MTAPSLQTQPLESSAHTVHQIWMEGELHLKEKEPELYHNMLMMKKLHNNQHCLWSKRMIHTLIKEEYPELLSTYNNYPDKVMKVHLAKYIILDFHAGFYVDIDCKPKKCLYELTNFKDFHRRDLPIIIKDKDEYNCSVKSTKKFLNNYFLWIPYPHHQLMKIILNEIPKVANRKPLEPHLKWILRCCGPYLLTKCVKKYKKMTQKELKKNKNKPLIHDIVTKHDEELLSEGHSLSSPHSVPRRHSRIASWSDLSQSLSRSELRSAVHTQDVVNLVSADELDFYLHCNGHGLFLKDKWVQQLKKHNKVKLGAGQAAVVAVCVGALILVL